MSDPLPTTPKILVKTETLALRLPPAGFVTASGEMLPALEVAYERYGTLAPDGRNVIFVCHALTGDAHAAFYHRETDRDPGWWDGIIGPGKALDTDRYHIICANMLGGCKGTTGPSSIDPRTGRPYGATFPLITVKDAVRAEKLFLDQLGITELYAVIGGSVGGMMALEWAVSFPDYVRRCICVASGVHLTPQALSFDIIGRQEIESDPHWAGGNYATTGEPPRAGLSRARQIGHVTYLSPESMTAKFGREQREAPITPSRFSTNFQVESYLNYQGQKFIERFDANSYLYITRMADVFDLRHEYGTLSDAFARTQARFLIISVSSDWLFPPAQQLEIVSALLSTRKPVSYFQIDAPSGHDAFLLEFTTMNQGITAFLDGAAPAILPPAPDRLDYDLIAEHVTPRAHALDVGSGDGGLLLALQQAKQVTGVCLDKNFAMVVAAMHHGLPAIQLDADSALELVPADAFDVVLLNQTIQQLHSALRTIKQIVRIAPTGVIGFPNFAYYRYRFGLLFGGHLPVSDLLPYDWYDTPNIHLVTVKDFRELCRKHGFHIRAIHYLSETAIGRTFIACGATNLGAERVLTRLARDPG